MPDSMTAEQPVENGFFGEEISMNDAVEALVRQEEEPQDAPVDNDVVDQGESGEENQAGAEPEPDDEVTVEDDEPAEEAESDDEEAEEEPDDDDGEELVLETVADLAEALGKTEEEVMSELKVKIKVNGEEKLVPLAEAQTGHQLYADYTRKTQEHAEAVRQFDGEVEQTREFLQGQHYQIAAMVQMFEQSLQQEYASVPWQQLREENPGEFAAAQADFTRRYNELENWKTQGAQAWEQVNAVTKQRREKILAEKVKEGMERLPSLIPEWKDQAVKERERVETIKTLVDTYGATKEDIEAIDNPMYVAIARDAMKYRQILDRQQKAKGKKPARKVKSLKPGAGRKVSKSTSEFQRRVKIAQKAQTDDAWADALAAKFGG